MDQNKKQPIEDQIMYLGRWVSLKNFRAYVYNATTSKLANSYDEFKKLIESGLWFATLADVEPKHPVQIRSARKAKNGADS